MTTTDITLDDPSDPLDLVTTTHEGPPKIILYGIPGIGKSSWAADAPSPIYIPVEQGLARLKVPAFPKPASFAEIQAYIKRLRDGKHDYKTLVIDTIDALEPMLFTAVAESHGKENIEGFGFFKGYSTFAPIVWREFLGTIDSLQTERGMAIILIAHSTTIKVEPPDSELYDTWSLRLHKKTQPIVEDWADAILFAKHSETVVTKDGRSRGVGDGSRVLHTERKPAWTAKNRWSLPAELPFPRGEGWAHFMHAYNQNETKQDA